MLARVRREVLEPAIRELAAQGAPFQGVLYAGLMLAADGTLAVLEFNSRFGDPEAQALLPLLPGVTRHLADIAGGSWRPREASLPASRGRQLPPARSEEHTSELQSRLQLVCR